MLVAQAPGCKLCGPEYALDVRINRFGLTPRQYIWKGGVEPDTLPMLDEQGNQVEIDGVKQTIANPKAGQDWCFAYGENEWLNPDEFTSAGKKYLGGFSDYKTRALDDDQKRISCE